MKVACLFLLCLNTAFAVTGRIGTEYEHKHALSPKGLNTAFAVTGRIKEDDEERKQDKEVSIPLSQ